LFVIMVWLQKYKPITISIKHLMNLKQRYNLLIQFLKETPFTVNLQGYLLFNTSNAAILTLLSKLQIDTNEFDLLFSKTSEDGYQYKYVDGNNFSEFQIFQSFEQFYYNISSYKKTDNFIVFCQIENVFYGYF